MERLHKHQIYPIVLLIKFKSTKQIKEVKDARYTDVKVTAKEAKEMYEHTLKLESEYRHCISGKCYFSWRGKSEEILNNFSVTSVHCQRCKI